MIATRTQYLDLFPGVADAIAFEESVLQTGREFLPACADAALAGLEPTSLQASSADQAAAQFAAGQGWSDVSTVDKLAARLAELGGFLVIHEDGIEITNRWRGCGDLLARTTDD